MSATNVESVVKDLGRTMTNVDFCIIAATALSYYDFFLTFPEEYSCMWRRRFSGPTVFFFINRYFTLIDLSLMLVNLVSFEALSYDTGSKLQCRHEDQPSRRNYPSVECLRHTLLAIVCNMVRQPPHSSTCCYISASSHCCTHLSLLATQSICANDPTIYWVC
ncbi:hypothetical protein C8Q75DRAFT_591976 [Abortiporus biennis]|nr:hypothetical protein C8Q75DRAFT_591976 [Abortiporus biennis]